MTRLLIEDVTLKRQDHEVEIYIRFKTGTMIKKTMSIARSGNKPTIIAADIIEQIKKLSETHTAGEIAKTLNEANTKHPTITTFNTNAITHLFKRFKIPTRYERLRAVGYYDQEELSKKFEVTIQTIKRWRKLKWLDGEYYNDQKEYLYKPLYDKLPPTCRYLQKTKTIPTKEQ